MIFFPFAWHLYCTTCSSANTKEPRRPTVFLILKLCNTARDTHYFFLILMCHWAKFSSVTIWFYESAYNWSLSKVLPKMAHSYTMHTYTDTTNTTHTLSLSHTHTHTHMLTHIPHTHHTLSQTHTPLSLSHTHHIHTYTHTILTTHQSHILSLTYTLINTPLTHTHTHTHSHTHASVVPQHFQRTVGLFWEVMWHKLIMESRSIWQIKTNRHHDHLFKLWKTVSSCFIPYKHMHHCFFHNKILINTLQWCLKSDHVRLQ